jgi:hypothetical protein
MPGRRRSDDTTVRRHSEYIPKQMLKDGRPFLVFVFLDECQQISKQPSTFKCVILDRHCQMTKV